ncbi:MAG: general secretion pathway protein GspB [Deltaproteobacteria bacterium]|nr:general secretion pathway protein GspB [Deltaproteobacteria bacterium]
MEADQASEAEVLPEVTFSYSGYMEMGDRKIAIIDGMEYKTGEEIVPGGFVIRAIYPNKIVIGIKGKEEEITVPLVEEVL